MGTSPTPVSIIGAGWAGLAAAVELTHAGIPVNLFESANAAGGRARDIPLKELSLDNGQHLIIGAYKNVLKTMSTVGVDLDTAFNRQPLSLKLLSINNSPIHLTASPLPAPFHLLGGLLTKNGFSLPHRLQIARLSLQFLHNPNAIAAQRNVADWLEQHGQDEQLTRQLWEPLCLAILNTPINKASARIFLRVLKDSFLYKRNDSDLLFPSKTLSQLFVEPCINYIKNNGGNVYFNKRVDKLITENNKIQGIAIADKGLKAEQVILAIPPYRCHSLTASHSQLAELNKKLAQFEYQPITTVYLQYPASVTLEQPMIGLLGSYSQWIFDRAVCHQPGLMAVVISSDGPHMKLERDQLATLVEKEIACFFPHWPSASSRFAIREKRATFDCGMNIDAIRPENHTNLQGLWLAGDFTDTGYPATLEGAVLSGINAAKQVIENL